MMDQRLDRELQHEHRAYAALLDHKRSLEPVRAHPSERE